MCVLCVCCVWGCVCVCVLVTQLCPSLCYPMESSPRDAVEREGTYECPMSHSC